MAETDMQTFWRVVRWWFQQNPGREYIPQEVVKEIKQAIAEKKEASDGK